MGSAPNNASRWQMGVNSAFMKLKWQWSIRGLAVNISL
jgi:hypothetical protein